MPALTPAPLLSIAAAALAVAGTSACAGPQPTRAWIEQLAVSNAEAAGEFAGAGRVLATFEPARGDDDPWRRGDEVLFGVELERGAEAVERRLVLFRVQSEPQGAGGAPHRAHQQQGRQQQISLTNADGTETTLTSGTIEVLVEVFEQDGRAIASSRIAVAEAFLRRGFFAACRLADGMVRDIAAGHLPARDHGTLRNAYVALLAFVHALRGVPSLEDMLWQVVDKPSILSVLLHGVTMSLNARFDRTEQTAAPTLEASAPHPCYRLPIELSINGVPALFVSLVVAAPTPPLRLAAGVVGLDAMHPTAPERRLRLRLLAARHGDGSAGPFDDR